MQDAVPIAAIPFSEVSLEHSIKKGGMGEVFKGTYLGSYVAVKKLPLKTRGRGRASKSLEQAMIQECEIHSKLHCNNIVQFIGYTVSQARDFGFVLTELVDGPDLDTIVFAGNYNFSQQTKTHMCLGMTRAIAYLHGQKPPIIHQDIKPGNFVVNLNENKVNDIKLIDLGISCIRNLQTIGHTARASVYEGTYSYMAPEMLLEMQKGNCKSDIWSLACTCAELLSGKDIWAVGDNPDLDEITELQRLMKNGTIPHAIQALDDIDPNKSFLINSTEYEQEFRPTALEMVTYFHKETQK